MLDVCFAAFFHYKLLKRRREVFFILFLLIYNDSVKSSVLVNGDEQKNTELQSDSI